MSHCRKRIFLIAISVLLNGFSTSAFSAEKLIRIGVLAHRGKPEALKSWTPTAKYLSQEVPGYNFVIVPLNNDDIGPAVEYQEVEFVLTNPGSYAELEFTHGITRIATLKSKTSTGGSSVLGAVIFTRADRKNIKTLADLKGKKFMAVHENAFGGWWLAWHEFKRNGINPYRDFSQLLFNGFPQDNIVYAVRDGKVDAGTVRTELLESLALDGKIKLEEFSVLNRQQVAGFPYLLSTPLYPDWAFAVLRTTNDRLAQKVAIALLRMPQAHPAADAAGYTEWTVPMDYHSVQQIMMDLRIGPYQDYGKLSLLDLFKLYWMWLIAALLLFIALSAAYAYVLRLNRQLSHTMTHLEAEIAQRQQIQQDLVRTRDELENRVAERTAELARINEELETRVARRTAQLLSAMQRLEAEMKGNHTASDQE